VVQEAYLRAWKGFAGFYGGDARPWILTIVRNTCYTWLRNHSRRDLTAEFDEGLSCRPSSGNRLCFGNSKDCPIKRSARLLAYR
jgi:DNA-directed RNA polymerase specialized sigma24 family protein